MARLELRGVGKTYRGGIAAVRDVNLTVPSGALLVVVGPSGSGKSTLLRLIAGLEPLDTGSIHLGDRRIEGLAPRDRGLAMVFQDVVVYPHLDVFENIAFGLRARRVGTTEIRARVEAAATLLGLDDLLRRNPTTLSGGQKRRVTLARAWVLRPSLFLFDEPFSGLDAPLRAALRGEIADLHRQTGATMVLVTHDQGEALALADQMVVVSAGQVVQVGRPLDVYNFPLNLFVARFVGRPAMALLTCLVAHGGADSIRLEPVGVAAAGPWLVARQSPAGMILDALGGGSVVVGLRAERVALIPMVAGQPAPPPPGWVRTTATVDRLELAGAEIDVTLRLGPHRLATRVPNRSSFRRGDEVTVALDLDGACWFDPTTGNRLGAVGVAAAV